MRPVAGHRLLLAGILLLALAWRLALWSQPLHQPANDEVEYVQVARDLLGGRGWQFYESYHWLRAPLYPLFLAGSLFLAGGDLHRAALPNILLSVGLVGLVYGIARELARPRPNEPDRSRRAGLLAAMIFAGLQTNATFASLYMAETLFAFLFAAALLLLLRWQRLRAEAWLPRSLVLAGLLYGLAMLTRSLPLAFTPLVLLWIAWHSSGVTGLRPPAVLRAWLRQPQRLLPALLFLAIVVATVAPWTIRNCRAYASCILVETGLSYNLWAFSEPREDQQTISRVLENIPDPAIRADEATRRGLERLREDPAILLRKLLPEWVSVWSIKPIQDRFLQESYYADPPPLLFLAGLLFDDMLYLGIAIAAVFGAVGALLSRRPAAVLPILWGLSVVGLTLVTHGEGRYRHFFFMVMVPFAALALSGTTWPAERRARRLAQGLGGLPAAALAATILIFYPWNWAERGAARSVHTAYGNLQLSVGNFAAAENAYWRAVSADATVDGWLALGRLYEAQGDLAQAEEYYRLAHEQQVPYAGGPAHLGDFLRNQGREAEARAAFIGRYLDEQRIVDWSWNNLDPPPQTRIDIGAGLDFGYVGGVYPAEDIGGRSVRWTGRRAMLRLPAGAGLLLRVTAPRPDAAPVPLRVCSAGVCRIVELGADWRTIRLALPVTERAPVILHSPTFHAPDGRDLGVLLDAVEVITNDER
jgi:4-amino-4-deoxy-L-arabinose transferase-like glycosyltransferase